MKKTILATTLAGLLASTAQAATIYEKDNTSVSVYGDAEVVYINSTDETETDEISIDEANFGFDLGYAVNEDLTLTGLVEFGVASGTAELSDAYVGVASNKFGTVTVGKQATIFDDSGIGGDYQFGWASFYEQDDSGDQVVKYQVDKGVFYAGVAYLMNSESGQYDGSHGVDAKLGARVAGFDFTLFYGDTTSADGDDSETINFEARYDFDALSLAAAVAQTEADTGDIDSFGFAAEYQLNNNVAFAAGWANVDSESDANTDNHYYVNTSYTFTDNISVYAEIGGNDGTDSEVGYAAGMAVAF